MVEMCCIQFRENLTVIKSHRILNKKKKTEWYFQGENRFLDYRK